MDNPRYLSLLLPPGFSAGSVYYSSSDDSDSESEGEAGGWHHARGQRTNRNAFWKLWLAGSAAPEAIALESQLHRASSPWDWPVEERQSRAKRCAPRTSAHILSFLRVITCAGGVCIQLVHVRVNIAYIDSHGFAAGADRSRVGCDCSKPHW